MKNLLLLSFITLISCSHSSKKIQKPKNIEEAMMRESTNLTPHKVVTPDNELEFTVQASKAPVVHDVKETLNYYYTTVDIGSDAPMECYFYKNDVSPAGILRNLSDAILNNKKLVGKLLGKQTTMIGAGAIEGNPFLMMHTGFVVDENGTKLNGVLKTMVASKEVGSVVCIHNEVGYQKTFTESFSQIVSSFSFVKAPRPIVLYKDIMLMSLKGFPIGYIASYLTLAQNETKGWVSRTSFLLPADTQTYTSDDVDIEVVGKNGKVVYGFYKSEQDGKLNHAMEIKTSDGKNYVVLGTKDDQKVETLMQTKDGIDSNYEHTKLVPQKFLKEGLKHFAINGYLPDRNPAKPTSLKTTLVKSNAEGLLIRIDAGDQPYTAVVRKDGGTEALKIKTGEMEIEGKKIFSSGNL